MSASRFTRAELNGFAQKWTVIRQFCQSSHRQWIGSGGVIQETPPESFFNLAVVLAFSLLDEVLSSMSAHGAFSLPSGAMLGKKMATSRSSIEWLNYSSVEEGKCRRNDLAHRGALIPSADCREIVELISVELRWWGAIAQA